VHNISSHSFVIFLAGEEPEANRARFLFSNWLFVHDFFSLFFF
jgi:hypothetical protein